MGQIHKPEEELVTVLMGVVLAGALMGSAGVLWAKGGEWAVRRGLLVADPVVRIPGLRGAGLDMSRLALVIAALLVVAVVSTSVARAHIARGPADRRRRDRGRR